ncbi:MAG: DUF6030 family protein [Roseibium sp.]|uniref:DUF6030 family protein n=1 Tax=Roseibium sp. TaxID=1936156 RepID=UPI0026223AE3|nr:DUF6030 family protein [Roseibium sp.]MCV0428205.1 DUF6030 family protein [Roseibium sp.]
MSSWADKLRKGWQSAGGALSAHGARSSNRYRSKVRTSGPRWADHAPSLPDKKEIPLSDDRPNQNERSSVTRFYVWGTLALLAAGSAGGVIYWQVDKAANVNEAAAPILPDPLIQLDDGAKSVLLNTTPELAAQLKRSFLGKPDQLCTELQALGLENRGWSKAPFQRNRWQCASDLVQLTTPSVDFGPTTLFFVLRGPAEDKIDYLRLKLVVEDARQKEIGLEAVRLVIDALAGRYGWTVPSEFLQAISDFKQLETIQHGVQLSVAPEDPNLTGDPLADQRLNIILNFGEPDLIRPADRFEVAPPLESEWSAEVKDLDGPATE